MKLVTALQPYSKFIVALIGAIVTVVVQHYGDNPHVTALVPFLTAMGVYAKANK